MKKNTRWILGLVATLVGLSALACGDDTSSSSSSFSCCINGSYYTCPNSDAVNQCGQGDSSSCDRDSSKDSSECSD